MANLVRFARTVRYLRPSQVGWRLAYQFRRTLQGSSYCNIDRRIQRHASRAVYRSTSIAAPCDSNGADAQRLLAELEEDRITLLNTQRALAQDNRWLPNAEGAKDRLWTYTLHYHGWLVELACGYAKSNDSAFARQLEANLEDWLERCRLGAPESHCFAWNSFAIATRLDNWRQILRVLPSDFWKRRQHLQERLIGSMARQAVYLSHHIEWDLRANHLLRDALGLACAARLFEGKEARRWMTQAERLTDGQLDEQILDDGMHFERSPMYHLEVMRDLLKLAVLLESPTVVRKVREIWSKMAETSAWLRHGDGRVAQLNDGSAAYADDVSTAGSAVGLDVDLTRRTGGRWLESAGLVVWHGAAWTVFFDVGEAGPAYQPGHAHADTLTIECSYLGQRLFVDPGCHSYDNDDRRRYDRSTAAHNTVCIDGVDSSEVWHIFRVGRRARPVDTSVNFDNESLTAQAAHDGYDHLPGAPRHQRRLVVREDGVLETTDRVDGQADHCAEGGLLLAQDWKVQLEDDGWLLRSGNKNVQVTVRCDRAVKLGVQPATLHPDYGIEMETRRLTWRYQGELPLEVRIRVEPV